MPNIQGDYSLTEVATKLNISAAWINKVQRETGVCVKESAQGKRAEFSADDVKMLENVKLLRLLDYSLNDIKHIYELEKRIGRLGYSGGGRDREFKTIISNKDILFEGSGTTMENIDLTDCFDKRKDKYTEDEYYADAKKLFVISAEVARRIRMVSEHIKQLLERLSDNTNYATANNLF